MIHFLKQLQGFTWPGYSDEPSTFHDSRWSQFYFFNTTTYDITILYSVWALNRFYFYDGNDYVSEILKSDNYYKCSECFRGFHCIYWLLLAHESPLNLFTFSLAQKHVCSFYSWFIRQIWHAVHLHMLIQAYWRQVHTLIYVGTGTPFQPIKEYWACSHVEYLLTFIHKPENLRHLYCLHILPWTN